MEKNRGERSEADEAAESGAVREKREQELLADERHFITDLAVVGRETERAAAEKLFDNARSFTGSVARTEAAAGLRDYFEAASRSADPATAESAKAALIRLGLGDL